MQEQIIFVDSFADWSKVVDTILPKLTNKILVLLEGDLAAGKTTFVSKVAERFGLKDVSSPTFSLIQSYKNSQKEIHHVDLYRLENLDEIEAIGFWEIFEQRNSIIFVEWPSKVPEELWPLDWNIIKINIGKTENSEKRKVQIRY
ncbi:MAG: tRNA (adenosine(37)-N6)-threonylcarbamoyltransferase complex ATPase subunit type 1 TsaE [Pseudobdellovibrio sp.]